MEENLKYGKETQGEEEIPVYTVFCYMFLKLQSVSMFYIELNCHTAPRS